MSVKTFLSIMRLLVMVTRRPVIAVWENSQSLMVMSGNTKVILLDSIRFLK